MVNDVCDVVGCESSVERSLNIKKVEPTGLNLKDESIRQVGLCKEHYREWKKLSKGSIPDYYGN